MRTAGETEEARQPVDRIGVGIHELAEVRYLLRPAGKKPVEKIRCFCHQHNSQADPQAGLRGSRLAGDLEHREK